MLIHSNFVAKGEPGSKDGGFFLKQLTLLCNFYNSRNVLGNLTFDCDIRKGCGLSHCDFFFQFENENHKAAWFRKNNCFLRVILFIFIV